MRQSVLILLCLIPVLCFAAVDKSGVKPTVISLPSGPGSIEGLGESFEPQLNTGTASYRVSLKLPKIRGSVPELALEYNSGYGNGSLGMGWRLNILYIQRQTDKGLPLYQDNDTFTESNGEELVRVDSTGVYRCENETSFTKFQKQNDGSWLVYQKDGTLMAFGATENACQNQSAGQTFRWMISWEQDTNGNRIEYDYIQDSGQIYVKEIRYGSHATAPSSALRIQFDYETTRTDPVVDYRGRFRCITRWLMTGITLFDGSRRIRYWQMSYARGRHSLLTQVKLFGDDRANIGDNAAINKDFLPPMKLGYTSQTFNPTMFTVLGAPMVSFQNEQAELVDINGDGLPDILLNDAYGTYQSAINNGQGKPWDELKTFTFSPAARLADSTTHLADLSGNGRSKLLIQDALGLYYFPFSSSESFGTYVDFVIPGFFPIDDPNVRFVDINNDKASDLMATDAGSFSFLINSEDGTKNYFLNNPPAPPAEGISFKDGWQFADMNGDRLQDLVLLGTQEQGGTVFHANMGWGAFDTREVMTGGPHDTDLGYSGTEKLFLSDINHDGLADLIFVDSGMIKYWLNENGNRWGEKQEITTGIPDYDAANVAIRFADMNGNGSTDIVWNRTDKGAENVLKYLDFFPSEKPFQLNWIENGTGRIIEIAYTSSTAYMTAAKGTSDEWTSTAPFPVDVVSSFTVHDGVGNTYRSVLTYRNGYYDGNKKEFRGFEFAQKREVGDASAPDLVMSYTYDTGAKLEALKGKPLKLETQTANKEVFYRETYAWTTRKLADGAAGDIRKVIFPYQQTKIRDILEKNIGAPVQLKWEYEYDNYGNMTRQTEHGRMDEGWDDEQVTATTFTSAYLSGVSKWILDKPVEISVSDETGSSASKKRNYYDGNSVLGEVSKGNLTKMEDWISGDKYAVSVRNQHDDYGNITAAYDPLYGSSPGHYREMVYDGTYHSFPLKEIIHAGITDLTMTAAYDYGVGVMTSSTEYNGFTTTYEYDTFGRLISITKPPDAGHTLEYDYVSAHDLGNGSIINWVETRQKDQSSDGFLKARTFYDGMGRKIMTRTEGEDARQMVVSDTVKFNARQQPWKKYLPYFETGTLDFVDPTFNTGYTEHFYDALAREIKMIQPDKSYSVTVYKPLSKTVQDEEQTNSISPHYGCGMRYIEDGLQDKDGKGRLREVYEIVKLSDTGESIDSPAEWLTAYQYDLNDNLTRITDSFSNQKFFEYDGLKRKTSMNDPDRGKMVYTYDEANNLIKTVDAKGQVILYTYDGVNRMTAEYYGEGKTSPDVEYHYDTTYGALDKGDWWQFPSPKSISNAILKDTPCSNCDMNSDGKIDVADVVKAASLPKETITARNTKGFLSYIKDQSGEEHNSYDERGRVEWVIKRIRENDGSLSNFFTGMTYDSMDRVTSLTYPDQTAVTYTFNSRGLIESVPNIITQYHYNPAGQNALLELACGVKTAYDYDSRLRLNHLNTKRTRDNFNLQDLTYTYDGVSNITAITDARVNAELDTIGNELGMASADARKFSATQSFSYDSLYRLTQAANPGVFGTTAYRYDRIGNMIQKNASLLQADPLMDLGAMTCGGTAGTKNRIGRNAGDAPGPHAVTGTEKGLGGAMTFMYDDNGNMTHERGMTLNWDYKDRLTGLTIGSKTASYLYDYTDTRKKKTVTDAGNGAATEAVYIDKFSEIRDGKLIKYVYAGTNRAARYEDGKPTFYLHDHLGSTAIAVSETGGVTEQLVNYPYGNPRLEKKAQAAIGADYKFTGKERDMESGLQYFEARYYEGVLGRFVSVDPLPVEKQKNWSKTPQKQNLYHYALNNPIILTDPKGTFPSEFNGVNEDQRFAQYQQLQLIEIKRQEIHDQIEKFSDPKIREEKISSYMKARGESGSFDRWFNENAYDAHVRNLQEKEKSLADLYNKKREEYTKKDESNNSSSYSATDSSQRGMPSWEDWKGLGNRFSDAFKNFDTTEFIYKKFGK